MKRVWLVAVSGWLLVRLLGSLWPATQLSSPTIVQAMVEAKQVQVSEPFDPYLELDAITEIESINAGSFQPWTSSAL